MRVLQINSAVNMGSVGRRAEDIGNMLLKKGDESYVGISSRLNRPSTSNLIVIGNKLDVALHGIKSRLFDRHAFGSKSVTQDFIKEIEKIKPDIIHLRNLHGYYINIEVLFNYLAKADVPVVWTFHDCWPFTGHCVHFENVNCYKWKTQCYECPKTTSYPKSFMIDNSRMNYSQKKELFTSVKKMVIVGVCQWIENYIKESFFKKYQTAVIYNGINTEIFNPDISPDALRQELGFTNEKIVLGSANVWSSKKGYENFKGLDDFIYISKKMPSDVKILLIGLSKEQQKTLPPNIIPIDRTDNINKLAAFYTLADVFVNPTHLDNFPTTNIESLSAGTPVVTYRTGGCPEAVDPNTGIVVEKSDKDGLYDAIMKILLNGKQQYTVLCRERALKYFDQKDTTENYYKLYKKMLNI